MVFRTILCAAALAAVVPLPADAGIPANAQTAGLQAALRARHLYAGPIDAIRGPATVQAVHDFQRRAGLATDGVAGAQTRAALGLLGRPLFGNRMIVRGEVGWDVSVLQFLLRRAGYASGSIDGSFGARTEAAVRRYQRVLGLHADGIVGRRTIAALSLRYRVPVASRPVRVVHHLVRVGDTLTAIAQRYRTTVSLLARANGLDPNRYLFAGARLRIPTSDSTPVIADPFDVRLSLSRWSSHYGVDARLTRALAWQESGFNNSVVSSAGAMGVMQLLPQTWDYVETVLVGTQIPHSVDGNVHAGIAYLHQLLVEFHGDKRLALGAWYQGADAVRKHGFYEETKTFVANVLALELRM
jgi:Putative peptidoglycan-binding domain-containing protein